METVGETLERGIFGEGGVPHLASPGIEKKTKGHHCSRRGKKERRGSEKSSIPDNFIGYYTEGRREKKGGKGRPWATVQRRKPGE